MDEDKSEYLDYQQSIVDLRHYLTNQQSEQRFSSVMAQPNISHHPDMWLLSISQRSAKMAAQQGMGFAVGTFYCQIQIAYVPHNIASLLIASILKLHHYRCHQVLC